MISRFNDMILLSLAIIAESRFHCTVNVTVFQRLNIIASLDNEHQVDDGTVYLSPEFRQRRNLQQTHSTNIKKN